MTEEPEPLEPPITHNAEASRFEIGEGTALAVLDYHLAGGKMIFTHTGVPPALEGCGIGSCLAHTGLDYARAQGLKVVPLCSFIAGYIRKHPEYQDLVE
jgi:predicted GNAT family acetyltransferase